MIIRKGRWYAGASSWLFLIILLFGQAILDDRSTWIGGRRQAVGGGIALVNGFTPITKCPLIPTCWQSNDPAHVLTVRAMTTVVMPSRGGEGGQGEGGGGGGGQPPPDLFTIRNSIRQGDVHRAFNDLIRLKRMRDAPIVPIDVYEELIARCNCKTMRHPSRLLSLAQEAALLYLRDSVKSKSPPPIKAYRQVLQASSKIGDVDGSLTLLRLLTKELSLAVDEHMFFLVIQCLANNRKMSLVGPLLRQMDELHISRTTFIYSALLKGYGRQGWLDKIKFVEREMRERGIVPDLVTMNSMLDAYARCGEVVKVKALLKEMMIGSVGDATTTTAADADAEEREGGVRLMMPKPDIYSYNIVLKAMGQAKDVTGALKLYQEMEAAGVSPDIITVNTLITACTKAGLLTRAYNIIESRGSSGSVTASVEGYSALLNGFIEKGKIDQAYNVLEKMQAAGVHPNAYTYTALIKGAAGNGNRTQMMEIFQNMITQGEVDRRVRPTVVTYNTIMAQLVKRGDIEKALELRDDMIHHRKLQPDIVTCNIILDGLFKAEPPRTQEAEAVFFEMLEKGPKPDQFTFSTLFRAYQPPKAEMIRPPASPLAAIKNVVVGAATAGGKAALGSEGIDGSISAPSPATLIPGPERLFDMLLSNQDVVLDTTAVNTIILAFLRNGSVKKALQTFEDFKAGNITERARPGRPDVITYSILIKGIAATDNMYAGAKIMQLYREMRSKKYAIKPDLQFAYALLNSFARARSRVGGLDLQDLEEVFEDLRRLGWTEESVAKLEEQAWAFQGLLSEAWKEKGAGEGWWWEEEGGKRRQGPETASSKLFKKYRWNTFDSGFSQF